MAPSRGAMPEGFRVTVERRIVEGQLVVNQEHFTACPARVPRRTK
ncbi:MAG: hypothetical protein ABI665_24440 [Vicinamibacterales bacterium]